MSSSRASPGRRFSSSSARLTISARAAFARNTYIADPVEFGAMFKVPDEGPPGLWRIAYPANPDESDEALLAPERVEAAMQRFCARPEPYEVRYKSTYRVHQRVAASLPRRPRAARRRCRASQQSARRLRPQQRHPRRGQSRRQARPPLSRRRRRRAARSLFAPAPRRHDRAGAGDVDPQQAHDGGARPGGAAPAAARDDRDRRRSSAGAPAYARYVDDFRAAAQPSRCSRCASS